MESIIKIRNDSPSDEQNNDNDTADDTSTEETNEKHAKRKSNPSYYCKHCKFTSKNKTDFSRHEKTAKHIAQINSISVETITAVATATSYCCQQCNKEYKNRSGLWKHAQQCEASAKSETPMQNESQVSPANTMVSNEMIMCLIQQNKELQTTLIELAKEARTVNNTSNTTNNQFNLNVFLNEECKHALNIQEFIDSIKVTLEDFMETGRLGYMQGITRILVDAVHKLDVKLRPFHCTDIKRETLYIKDKDTWEKANAEKTKLRNAITQVARKNLSMLSVWQAQNPDFVKINTPECEEFIRLSLGVVGSQYLEEQYKTEDRIVKNILREIVIDKKVSHIDNA
jgi:hypothetical protein